MNNVTPELKKIKLKTDIFLFFQLFPFQLQYVNSYGTPLNNSFRGFVNTINNSNIPSDSAMI